MVDLSRRLRCERGQTATEFGLGFLVFALAFLAILEFGHLMYAKMAVRSALREAGRYMVTGRADIEDPNNPGSTLNRASSIGAVFEQFLLGTGTGLHSITMNPGDGGGPGDTVTLTARLQKIFVTPLFAKLFPAQAGCPKGSFCFNLTITWVNEPFPSGSGGGGGGTA